MPARPATGRFEAQGNGHDNNHSNPESKQENGNRDDQLGNGGWKKQGIHENWWRSISAKTLVAPWWYFPFCFNSFLSPMPWQQVFDHVFGANEVKDRIYRTKI